jgi:dystonin
LLFNATNHRLKCLINLNDYVKSVNEELEFLEFREEIELNRDWSVLEKLNSINLRNHKQKLDDDINKRDTSHIQLVLHKGNALISDKHPASNIIQTHMEALTEHLEWIRQLSSLLAIHIQSLTDYECFNSECKQLNESLNQLKKNLLHLLSNSKAKNLTESITRTEDFKVNLLNLKLKIDKLILKSKSLIPLRSRKLKLKPPFNVCKSLITFKNDQININKDEECIIENNSDLAWKLVTPNGQVSIIFLFFKLSL